jgi:hypothetical protein
MSFIKNQIEKAYKKNELISVCLNNIDWNSRIIGYVKKIYASNKFELEIIDEFGQKKNRRTVLFASVKSLEMGGVYNENLANLNKKRFLKNQSTPKYFSSGKYDLPKKLSELKESKTLSTFFFDTEFSIGIVMEITQKELFILNIAYDGTEDGISIFDVTLLTKIRCETNFETRISFLTKLSHSRRSQARK